LFLESHAKSSIALIVLQVLREDVSYWYELETRVAEELLKVECALEVPHCLEALEGIAQLVSESQSADDSILCLVKEAFPKDRRCCSDGHSSVALASERAGHHREYVA